MAKPALKTIPLSTKQPQGPLEHQINDILQSSLRPAFTHTVRRFFAAAKKLKSKKTPGK